MTSTQATTRETVPARFAQHLVSVAIGPRCELTAFPGEEDESERPRENRGRCTGVAVAIRWSGGFADDVCRRHAEHAEQSEPGAVVVFAQRHNGTQE